jgi:hypothetical protein
VSQVWLGARGWSVLLVLLSSCAGEAPGTVWRIALADHTVGQERRIDVDDGWTSKRRYSMLLGDEVVVFEASSRWTVAGDHVVAWQSGNTSVAMSLPLPDNLFAEQTGGPGRVFDPNAGIIRIGQFEVAGDRHSFTDGEVHWWVEHRDGDMVAYGADSVSVRRDEGPIESWTPVDPAVILGLAGSGPLAVHGQLFARLRVRGEAVGLVKSTHGEVEIRRPLWEEIPNHSLSVGAPATTPLAAEISAKLSGLGLREALGELAVQVPQSLRYSPTPVADPRAALHGARGDCTEHVALFVEASAALGIDARAVVGWVGLPSGNWVPHAWAVVTVPGVGDVPVDPTLGQRIASPMHLPLADRFQGRPWEGLGKAVGSSIVVLEVR